MSVLGGNVLDGAELAKAGVGDAATQGTTKEAQSGHGRMSITAAESTRDSITKQERYEDTPTEEELHSLRRVSGKIPWAAWTIAFCELCERFSYYGTTVVYVNYIQQPLPEGSRTGAGGADGQSGALGMGQQASTGLTLFNQFWAYVMPLFGAYIADAHLGRFKTVHIAIAISIVAHVILTASAAPSVLSNPGGAKAAFIIGLVSLGVGTGFFKANISPMLAEQVQDTRLRVTTLEKTGERVIIDPAVTNTRVFLYFYFCINVGSLVGQIAMVYAEKYVGFYLAYLLPTVLFLCAPVVLAVFKKHYRLTPPTGSVLSKFMHMFFYAAKGHWFSWKSFTWDVARPSNVAPESRPSWMTYDDAWVDEVRRGLMACKVFLFLPLFHLAYNQMTGNLTSQAATMELHGVPNDLIQNLNPISIVIMIPIMDYVVYPGFRKMGFNFTPIKRMCTGFFFGSASMIAACVTQWYIYRLAPCGNHAGDSDCIEENGPAPINVWVQVLPYIFIGISEIFTNVTSYEYAFSKAPTNMRSLVMSINLFMSAFASAIGQAFTPVSTDPLLVWNYGIIACLAFAGGVGFWLCFSKLDKQEDQWNSLAKSAYHGKPTRAGSVSVEPVTETVNEKI
jgi:POT family proton-dependent oligopeptide transporter